MNDKKKGFVLLDVLTGLFIFSLGFAVMLALINTAYIKNSHTDNILQAVNLASSTVDEITVVLLDDPSAVNRYLNGTERDESGRFSRTVCCEWDSQNLLKISVKIIWTELKDQKEYNLTYLHYIAE
ncbi:MULTISPECIES: hypothetical protein [Dehalobacter]|jgi:hypothetical protein|uniref:Type II secretion system protein n=2 Tax=Dehalobacter restrictus TaxID=55583 RepID=A0A857DJ32_9FIRM|nr:MULTISPECIES: hypothetical protein [Dehalobacter]AHF09765.1 N-terminal cleavage protein [Dehalobacter restrictus DSM 9455]MCG1026483.1 hypothetical protein [Dehalobacter sp.]MDJ0304979.1 hypothetical protein [Dehalobacter sp.]OCZ52689.1 hypothetical protein A7D23_09175 [Dehalobacter sp. TeCB1]QHA00355.1 hypothetical protein GQ588_06760 [Dehalobacter restrictus]